MKPCSPKPHDADRPVGAVSRPNPVVTRFLALLAEPSDRPAAARLCEVCVAVLPVRSAAVVLHSDAGGLELLCASDETTAGIEATQATIGDGPGVEAISSGEMVVVTDLAAVGSGRWPLFTAVLDGTTPRAMFAIPLQIGAIRLGVLDLYRDITRSLTVEELAAMSLVAHAVTMTLLHGHDGTSETHDGPGQPWWDQSSASRTIHQATGMVVAQLGVPARVAYLRLQGHALAHNMLLAQVAEDVVTRRLRLRPDRPTKPSTS